MTTKDAPENISALTGHSGITTYAGKVGRLTGLTLIVTGAGALAGLMAWLWMEFGATVANAYVMGAAFTCL